MIEINMEINRGINHFYQKVNLTKNTKKIVYE